MAAAESIPPIRIVEAKANATRRAEQKLAAMCRLP
jgi:hypothetical protein